jgi:hypothetical protein
MAKNLIIGGCTNYGINQLKPWVLSINETMPDAHKVMCVGNASQETLQWLSDQGFELVQMPSVEGIPIHVLRFLSIHHYLHHNWKKFDYVITTDVKDVYFQADPFKLIDTYGHPLLIASEGLKYKDESWGDENLMQAYGPYVYDLFKDNTIYNVGTFGGKSEYVKDMVFNIFTNAINRPIPICDQAVFNVLIGTQPFKDVCARTDNWACEAGTVADPSKIAGFRPNLLCGEPVFKDGIVYTSTGDVFPIVHQYDRVPEWKKFVQEKFGQDDESQFFVYKV